MTDDQEMRQPLAKDCCFIIKPDSTVDNIFWELNFDKSKAINYIQNHVS